MDVDVTDGEATTHRGAPAVRDVLGLPMLGPASATRLVLRVRVGLARARAALAPPPVRILEALFSVLDHRVLVVLCDAGVPDHLDGPTSVGELARRVDADPVALRRLLRLASNRGWVRLGADDVVRPSPVTRFLRRDHPGGWRAWADFLGGDEVVAAIGRLGLGPPDVSDAFAAANGSSFFDWMAAHPDRNRSFDEAMASGARLHAIALAAALDWSGSDVVCDVGGGDGTLLRALVDLVPDLTGVLVDLPHVVERAPSHPRVEHRGGDAFEVLPAGADTYLFVNVLHDWADREARQLLRRASEAMPAGGRVVVVEGDAGAAATNDIVAATDVLMAALTPGGRERDHTDVARLASTAGLSLARTVDLASGDVAHVLRAPPRPG